MDTHKLHSIGSIALSRDTLYTENSDSYTEIFLVNSQKYFLARRFNENFAMENQGKNFHAHVKEAVDAGNAKYKAEQTAQKDARLSAERARKQEIMDQRNAERQALAAKREERRQVKIRNLFQPHMTLNDL